MRLPPPGFLPPTQVIRGQRFDATGNKIGGEFQASGMDGFTLGTRSLQINPMVRGTRNGGFIVTWLQTNTHNIFGDSTAVNTALATPFDASGTAMPGEEGFDPQGSGTGSGDTSPSVAALADNSLAFVWGDHGPSSNDASSNTYDSNIQINGFRRPLGPFPFPINDSFITFLTATNAAALPGNGYVAAWDKFSNNSSGDIHLRFLANDGVKLMTEIQVNTAPVLFEGTNAFSSVVILPPGLAALADGHAVVAWRDEATGNILANMIAGPPGMDVTGLGHSIADNDTMPAASDDTDFGNVDVAAGMITHTFTVRNPGNADLTLTGAPKVSVSGPNAADFTVTAQPTSPVPPGGSTSFSVQFDPSAAGLRTATLSIDNNAPDIPPYTFAIQGTGTTPPEIDVTGMGVSIVDGDTTPSAADDTDFGAVVGTGGSAVHSFTIHNLGLDALDLSGTPKVGVSGAGAADFTVTMQPTSPVAGGGSTSFDVTFDPVAAGLRSAIISIANNDSNENPYTFTVQGTGTNTPPTGMVVITGSAVQGQTLTADTSTLADADGLGTFSYQWKRNGAAIAGATASTYTLVQADVGSTITVTVSYTDGGGTAESLTSAPTTTVKALLFTLTVSKSGLGGGTVSSAPAGIDCGATCSFSFALGTSVTLTPTANAGSAFGRWSGDCTGSGACVINMTADRTVDARFTLTNTGTTSLTSSVLPASRTGYFPGGPAITVFATVINAGANPAQGCAIAVAAGDPVSLAFQQTNAANAPFGAMNPLFDLAAGQKRSFVLFMTPTATSPGQDVFPDFTCDNASTNAIPGVNTAYLTILGQQGPDILSINATPSADGIIHVPSGGTGFMTISAINIGSGDSTGSQDAAVTVSVDTGNAALPLNLKLCQTDANSICTSALGPSVDTVIGNSPAFFAVFVDDRSSAGIPLDAANARIFLRIKGATSSTILSVTSAAVTVPAPADAPVAAPADMPQGRWAVMVRTTRPDQSHTQRPGTLYVRRDGAAWLQSGGTTLPMQLAAAAEPGRFTGLERAGALAGLFEPARSITLTDEQTSGARLDIWGVHDVRPVPGR